MAPWRRHLKVIPKRHLIVSNRRTIPTSIIQIAALCGLLVLSCGGLRAIKGPDSFCPTFEWPPPRWSGAHELKLPRERWGDSVRLATIDSLLCGKLATCGYSEWSYYAVPDGFAIVTRIEQIDKNGAPLSPPHRWCHELQPLSFKNITIADYLRSLVKADPGLFRIIVFMTTTQPLTQSSKMVSQKEAMDWLTQGFTSLPLLISDYRLSSKGVHCTALIYEFLQKRRGTEPILQTPGILTGLMHLHSTGIVAY